MREFIPKGIISIPDNAKLAFKGKIFDVYQWPQKLYDGTTATFEMLRRDDTVNVIGVKDGKVVIVRQRQPRKDWFYSFPGGRHDHPDENELAAAKREMLEETGMTFSNWRLIDVRQPYAKMDWLIYTFVATDFVNQIKQELDGGEQIEVVEVDFDQIKGFTDSRNRLDIEVIRDIDSLEELLKLPALYNY